ncbi:ODV-ec27 [Euproctis pseudoconspersa nucleopolyhedrovirus]|uniref:ODV-ec27 n=1 Tax=Euproctis pseudoconspersa nucleopolyhedrovirus TaxID=307467 RepID=C3TWR9_9ABAC|nr:ODV-ec27 [Euproctis pseudoconspersa nucleopolyhedrovirus]ACO53461.1 ODV-ec27 [Euproctis pseudoconspersa nucleopolyhedrovirus]QUJ09205.1 ODV-ec27 protein [Gynaephora ruoergensis nucleopolyhedrovirus]
MKKAKHQSAPKIRTVTEIISGKDKLKRDYDLTEFDAKNLNSLESYNNLQIKLILVKYIAMLSTLNLTQPLLTIFKERNMKSEINTIILASLGFSHNRVNPIVNNFDNRMEFEIVENPQHTIPGEPIVFMQNENEDIVCYIDRASIAKTIDRQFDVDICVDSLVEEQKKIKIMKAFTKSGLKRLRRDSSAGAAAAFDEYYSHRNPATVMINETVATQYLNLLFIIEHAYCHYCILKNYGVYCYIKSMVDHTMFSNKYRPTSNITLGNLLLSKFKFSVEELDKTTSNTKSVKMLSYSSNSNVNSG